VSEWNLSVRLSGQGSDLSRILRDASREARTLSRDINTARRDITQLRQAARGDIRIRVSVDAGDLRRQIQTAARGAGGQSITVPLGVDGTRLRSEVRRALATAGTGNRITIPLHVDAGSLRAEVRRALTAAGTGNRITIPLDVDAGSLGRTSGRVSASLSTLREEARDTAHSLNVLQRAAREAGGELAELRTRAVTAAAGVRSLNTASNRAGGRLDDLSASTRTFRGDLDDLDGSLTRVGGRLGDLRGRVGGLSGSGDNGSGGLQGVLSGLLTLAPAAIPLVAGLTADLAPLATEFGAAGIAGAAFGIAVAGQIGPLGDAADAEKKYQQAVVQHGRTSKQALQAQLAYQQQLAQMPPETQRAAVALSTLKGNFSDWSNSMARFTMEPVTNGIAILDTLIPRLTPEVKSASTQLNRLVAVAGGAIATPGFDSLSTKIASFTDGKLDQLTDQVIHFIRVLSEGDVSGGALGAIIDYARQNGPAAREAISAISQAVITLVQGAAQAGPGMLALVTAAARLVAALPPELVGIILSVASALKILQLSGAGMAALAGGIARVRAQIVTLSGVSAAAGGGLAGLRAAFLSLGTAAKASLVVAGIAAVVLVLKGLSDMGKKAPPNVDRLTTSLGNLGKSGKVSGEAARAFGKDFSGLSDSLRTLSRPSNMDKTQQFLTKLVGMDSTPVADAKKNLDAVDKSLASLVQGGKADIAEQAFDKIAAAMRKQGMSGKELKDRLDDYKSALADQRFEQELAAASMGVFGKAAQDTQAKLDAQKNSADGLRQSIVALNDAQRQGLGGMIGFEAAIDAASKAAKDNAGALSMTHGQLDLNSEKARNAAGALQDLADKTDGAATAARESGASWETVNGIYERGRASFIKSAEAMGLTSSQAKLLADQILSIPDKKSTTLEMRTEDAINGLDSVIAAIKKTPNSKSVTVSALTKDAVSLLESLGFKVKQLPNGQFKVTALTGAASKNLAAVQAARNGLKDKTITLAARDRASGIAREIQAAIAGLRSKTVTITTVRETIAKYSTIGRPASGQGGVSKYADGGIAHAANGLFVPGYAPRRDIVPAILSPGEGVLVPETVRKLAATTGMGGQGIIKALNMWGRYGTAMRFADGGIAGGVQHFASGGFTYSPTGTMKSISDVSSAYTSAHQPITKDEYTKKLRAQANAVGSLRTAEARLAQVRKGHHTHAQLVAAENAVAKARRGVATATDAAKSAEARYKKQFSLSDWNKTLSGAVKANAAYEANLNKIASRGGADVVDQLRDMGAEGATMVAALAKASKSQFNSIVANLRKLAPIAKATLADYTKQLNASTKTSAAFQANLAKLAGMGYGDLATQLAAQGDDAAQKLAADAVKSPSSAAKANSAAKSSANSLTSDQLTELVQIIAAISSSKTGIHDVAGKTGIGEDEIITVANKAKSQIQSSLGSRSAKFLADLGNANKHLAYANGGIRSGIYSTRGGAVTFAEPETGGEAYLPLGPNKRRHALPVLSDVAHRFGLGLTDVAATRPVVIVRGGGDTHVSVTAVRTNATASDIGSQVGRSVRRARRGGVAARAAA
jgi:hypothetical protein